MQQQLMIDRGNLGSRGNAKGLGSAPQLFPASRPFGPDSLGLLERKCLCGPSARYPGLRACVPLVPKTPQSPGSIPENRNLGFPQPSREKAPSSSPPPPQVSSFLQGRGLVARAAFARGPGCEVSSPQRRPGPRAHTFIHTLTHIHTLTRPQTHTLRRASKEAAEIAAGCAHFPSFPTGGARGAGSGQWRNW